MIFSIKHLMEHENSTIRAIGNLLFVREGSGLTADETEQVIYYVEQLGEELLDASDASEVFE